MQNLPTDSPLPIVETLTAFHGSGALRAGIELDLFTRIAAGKRTAGELAADAHASERGMRILCDALTVMGFLVPRDQGYDLAPTSRTFLDRNSPLYIGSLNTIMTHGLMWQAYHDVAAAVQRGGTVLDKNALTPDHPFWVDFATAMAPVARLSGHEMAEVLGAGEKGNQGWRVLDIACGSGYYGFSIAQRDRTAQVTSVDWPTVLERTRGYADEAGVADRVRYLPGNLFEVDYGQGYDLALLTNIYHHFDRETCLQLSQKVARALKPGGRAAILESLPNDGRTGPPAAVMFSLTMLVWTPAGEAYTLADYKSILARAGFGDVVAHTLQSSVQQLIVATR
jgi:ubiquinone/menaquinone biosynthesis C-methylase UbiE